VIDIGRADEKQGGDQGRQRPAPGAPHPGGDEGGAGDDRQQGPHPPGEVADAQQGRQGQGQEDRQGRIVGRDVGIGVQRAIDRLRPSQAVRPTRYSSPARAAIHSALVSHSQPCGWSPLLVSCIN